MKESLLIVDDEKNLRISLKGILDDEGFSVDCAESGEECLEKVTQKTYDLIFLDVWLPGIDGLEVLEKLKNFHPRPYVIVISGHGSIETAVRATKLGAFDFIEKPLSSDKIMVVLENALKQKKLEEENRGLKAIVQRESVMVGNSVSLQALRQQISYAAPTEGRVLIFGENGSGKEVVARQLHVQSLRSSRPFIEVNCAAIPEDLIETELFGSVKGAFTGASENRKGKFQLADKGTLFLDEVGDMCLKTQAKVLRVLEEQRFYPVGSTSPVEVDVRVIAATNKDLQKKVEEGLFREDLFYRLNVIPFEIPPLRHHREDISQLARHFHEQFCKKYDKQGPVITDEIMERLKEYYWPGNIRELKNTVEMWVIMVRREKLELIDLPAEILKSTDPDRVNEDRSEWQKARENFERDYILRNLLDNNGNVTRTAAAIGMERSFLHRKLKAYNIKP
jgi:two-component system, NtrC family, nitrogen regulation response regulator NtrX